MSYQTILGNFNPEQDFMDVAGTFNVTIQDSPDGENWLTYATFAAAAANGVELVTPTRLPFSNVRAVVTTAGGPDATLTVELIYDKQGR